MQHVEVVEVGLDNKIIEILIKLVEWCQNIQSRACQT